MISLKKSSPRTIVLFHPGRAELLSGIPPILTPCRDGRVHELFRVLFFVDQRDGAALKSRRIWLRSLIPAFPPPPL